MSNCPILISRPSDAIYVDSLIDVLKHGYSDQHLALVPIDTPVIEALYSMINHGATAIDFVKLNRLLSPYGHTL